MMAMGKQPKTWSSNCFYARIFILPTFTVEAG